MLGQDFCECVKVCDLVKSKLALLLDAWGVKESELLTWEGCGKVTPCAFLNLSLGFNMEEFVRYLSRKKRFLGKCSLLYLCFYWLWSSEFIMITCF